MNYSLPKKFSLQNFFASLEQLIAWMPLLLFFSCANRVMPSGGIKDVIPPKIISSTPKNHSTNFNKKEIEIEFDEYIKLNDLSKQLIISPLIDPMPEITTNKRLLKIKFTTPLKENTTYTFNFGNAIADVHENNVLNNFLFVFSTGDFLDSLSVKGKIMYSKNLQTEYGVLVMLYKQTDDSVPYKKIPDYFSKTDSSGNYKINNICKGTFKIFALKDKNSNYLFDANEETIGFADSLIEMSDSSRADLTLFENLPDKIRLKNSTLEEQGKLKFSFNKRADTVTATALSQTQNPWQLEEYSLNRDTLTLWTNDTTIDSLQIVLKQNDIPFDTAQFVLKRNTVRKGTKTKTLFIFSNLLSGMLTPGSDLNLFFTHPVKAVDESKIIFKKDSVVAQGITTSFADSIKRNFILNYNWKENQLYELTFLPGAFMDFKNTENDTLKISFHIKPVTDLGSLLLKVKTDATVSNYIVQLVTEKDEVVREKNIASSENINFEFLNPGSYRVKIIYDANNNKRWDTGNYLKKMQPEHVVYFNDKLTVRSNWDLEQDWDLTK